MTAQASSDDIDWIPVGVGEHWFGNGTVRLTTLLGSCVALCIWHPVRHIGGLAHIVLPCRDRQRLRKQAGTDSLDPRYADEAISLFHMEAEQFGSRLGEYHAKIFGGGDMFDPNQKRTAVMEIGKRNIEAVETLLAAERVTIRSRHLGGQGHRKLVFDLVSGDVWLKFPGGRDALASKQQDRHD